MKPTADVVICGAGIAGISTAHQLAVHHGISDVVVVDERSPLSLTSDKSTEAYRNWWPGPDDAMVRLMNRSIDLLEELSTTCDNRFLLNRRGYLYATGHRDRAEAYRATGRLAEAMGAGALRIHTGRSDDPPYHRHQPTDWRDQPEGADLFLDHTLIRQTFPYLCDTVAAALHTRRCGWFSGQQLGMELLEKARIAGARVIEGRVEGVVATGGRVSGVRVAQRGETATISTRRFVNAAGPFLRPVAAMLGVELPVFSELHLKVSFDDHLGVVPRDAPLLIWDDPQRLRWTEEERELLTSDPETQWLVDELPAGVHLRPEGRSHILILWPYHCRPVPESFPIDIPDEFSEVCLRGMATLVPGLSVYLDRIPKPWIDGGYYTKTRDNRPLAGPLPVEGAYVHGALSGFGLMASSATAELVALQLTGDTEPEYATAFSLERFEDPEYLARFESWGDSGQL
jgi:glycine/D-amino acid oxidase-like deaminating enzyme